MPNSVSKDGKENQCAHATCLSLGPPAVPLWHWTQKKFSSMRIASYLFSPQTHARLDHRAATHPHLNQRAHQVSSCGPRPRHILVGLPIPTVQVLSASRGCGLIWKRVADSASCSRLEPTGDMAATQPALPSPQHITSAKTRRLGDSTKSTQWLSLHPSFFNASKTVKEAQRHALYNTTILVGDTIGMIKGKLDAMIATHSGSSSAQDDNPVSPSLCTSSLTGTLGQGNNMNGGWPSLHPSLLNAAETVDEAQSRALHNLMVHILKSLDEMDDRIKAMYDLKELNEVKHFPNDTVRNAPSSRLRSSLSCYDLKAADQMTKRDEKVRVGGLLVVARRAILAYAIHARGLAVEIRGC